VKDTELIALATQAATFFRRLVEEGVPVSQATQLAASFVSSSILAAVGMTEKPREPWEPGENGERGG